jgi:tRNA U38,U39,U40 pseudouridine synthase TruA
MGTIVEIIIKNEPASKIKSILEMKDRRYAGITAPADGLFLKKIIY